MPSAHAEPVRVCGHCAESYGHCIKGADGNPVLCWCLKHPEHMLLCSATACLSFSDSHKPYPSGFPYVFTKAVCDQVKR